VFIWPFPAMSQCACGVTGMLLCVYMPLAMCAVLLVLQFDHMLCACPIPLGMRIIECYCLFSTVCRR